MTTFTLNVQFTAAARTQLTHSTESIIIARSTPTQGADAARPVWVQFYNGSPLGINPNNTITWTESWDVDYATQVFSADGTTIQGEGVYSSSELGGPSAFFTTLTLDNAANWSYAGTAKSNFSVNNHHGTPVSFIYYLQTSVNNLPPSPSGNPVYTSSQLIEQGGSETVDLVQSVTFYYRGAHYASGTVVADSGSEHPVTIGLTGTNTTVRVDYSLTTGWDFARVVPSLRQVGLPPINVSGTDLVTGFTAKAALSHGVGENHIVGTITVKTAIAVAVAAFIIGGSTLNVSGGPSGTTYNYSYSGPLSSDSLALAFLNHVATWFSRALENSEQRKARLSHEHSQRA